MMRYTMWLLTRFNSLCCCTYCLKCALSDLEEVASSGFAGFASPPLCLRSCSPLPSPPPHHVGVIIIDKMPSVSGLRLLASRLASPRIMRSTVGCCWPTRLSQGGVESDLLLLPPPQRHPLPLPQQMPPPPLSPSDCRQSEVISHTQHPPPHAATSTDTPLLSRQQLQRATSGCEGVRGT